MSEVPILADDDDDGTASGEHQSHEPQKAFKEFFRFHPIRFCKYVAELAEREKTAKGKRDCYTDFVRCAFTMNLRSWPLRVAGVIAVVALIAYLLYAGGALTDERGNLNPNGLIVLLTIGLAAIAGVQWWTTWHQLETSRLDQRPWVCLELIKWDDSDYRHWELVMVAKNTGRSPAQKISLDMSVAWAAHGTFDSVAHASNSANFTRMFEGFVIPPGGIRSTTLKDALSFARPEFRSDEGGEYFFILRYRYTDLAGARYGTDHCCYWDATAQMFPVYGPLAKMY